MNPVSSGDRAGLVRHDTPVTVLFATTHIGRVALAGSTASAPRDDVTFGDDLGDAVAEKTDLHRLLAHPRTLGSSHTARPTKPATNIARTTTTPTTSRRLSGRSRSPRGTTRMRTRAVPRCVSPFLPPNRTCDFYPSGSPRRYARVAQASRGICRPDYPGRSGRRLRQRSRLRHLVTSRPGSCFVGAGQRWVLTAR
jgi:hypothetical protein